MLWSLANFTGWNKLDSLNWSNSERADSRIEQVLDQDPSAVGVAAKARFVARDDDVELAVLSGVQHREKASRFTNSARETPSSVKMAGDMLDGGVDIAAVQRFLGHSSVGRQLTGVEGRSP